MGTFGACPQRTVLGALWNHNFCLAFRTEEKSPPLSLFWKEWLPGGTTLGCHKQDCQAESHLFISQLPKCLWFLKEIMARTPHANPVTYFCLESPPPASEKPGLREGTRPSHPASQGTLESSPTWLLDTLLVAAATAPLLPQAGPASAVLQAPGRAVQAPGRAVQALPEAQAPAPLRQQGLPSG